MRLGDAVAVRPLFSGLDKMHRDRLPFRFREPPEEFWTDDHFEKLLADPDQAIFVAELDRVIGVAYARMESPPDNPAFVPERSGYLSMIYIDEDERESGVASALVSCAEAWAVDRGAKRMECNVYDFNERAQGFFGHAGYEPMAHHLVKHLGPQ